MRASDGDHDGVEGTVQGQADEITTDGRGRLVE
jgi:hypothetical protein